MEEKDKYATVILTRSDPISGAIPKAQAIPFSPSKPASHSAPHAQPVSRAAEAPIPPPAYPGQPIPILSREVDPIRKKLEDMRSITSGNPFSRNDSGYFYRQAKFMESFSDAYQGSADFFMYYPNYQQMSYNQLRTYFTWRAKVRRGSIAIVPLSYAFLYIYELLSGIGVENPADGLDLLMSVWTAFRATARSLDYYLPGWIYDYHIYYETAQSFSDFIRKHNLESHFREHYLFGLESADCLDTWNRISSYDITKSRFFIDDNKPLMRECFSAVVNEIAVRCESAGLSAYDLISRNFDNMSSWHPFQRALFFNWLDQPDRRVDMPGERVYICKDNHWTTNISIPYAWRRDLAAYIIKRTEMLLRSQQKFKFKIAVDPAVIKQRIQTMRKPRLEFDELDDAISKTVADYFREINRTVIAVDHENLARIRAEALGIQEALTVPEENTSALDAGAYAACEISDDGLPADDSNLRDFSCSSSPADESGYPAGAAYRTSAANANPDAPVAARQSLYAGLSPDGWDALFDALSETEIAVLRMLSVDNTRVKELADESGVMLEVLADNINEKAIDFLGDGILESGEDMSIYSEYKAKIDEMVNAL